MVTDEAELVQAGDPAAVGGGARGEIQQEEDLGRLDLVGGGEVLGRQQRGGPVKAPRWTPPR